MEGIIIALVSGLCVAVPNLVATLSANKKNNVNSVKEDIQKSIKTTEGIIKADIMKVRKSISEETLNRCKVDLINVMSRIQNGSQITEEERRILIEEKEQYNKLGGDSYVDDMFERLKKEGKL